MMSETLTFNHLLGYMNVHGYSRAWDYFYDQIELCRKSKHEHAVNPFDTFAKVCEIYGTRLRRSNLWVEDEIDRLSEHLESHIQQEIEIAINYWDNDEKPMVFSSDSLKPLIDKLNSLFSKDLITYEHYGEVISQLIRIDATFDENHKYINSKTFYKPQGEVKEILRYIINKWPDEDFDQQNYIENVVNEINWFRSDNGKNFEFHHYDFDEE